VSPIIHFSTAIGATGESGRKRYPLNSFNKSVI
jgi:hypothetical protein